MGGRFAMVPVEAFSDRRLTLEHLRVLGALCSFRGKDDDTVHPSRQAIAERTGMHPANISTATTALERLGWITKEGRGGHSKATRYTISVPETVAQQATVADSATVAQQATGRVADSARGLRVADSARGKEHTSEHTNRTKVQTFAGWIEQCRTEDRKPIAQDDAIFAWAEKAGIPEDWLRLAWIEFRSRYATSGKRYADWPAVFRNAVRGNWFKFWRLGPSNELALTTEGETARRAAEEVAP